MRRRPSALVPRPTIPLNERRALDASEVALAYGISQTFVKELTRRGVLKCHKLGKRTLYRPSECDAAIFGTDDCDQTGGTP